MSRATMVGFLVLGLALAGLAVAQFTQPEPPPAAGVAPGEVTLPRGAINGRALTELRRQVEALEARADGRDREIRGLEEALAVLGSRPAPDPEGAAPAALALVPTDLEQQVGAILDRRDEARQKRDRERRVERMAGFFLRDIQVSDRQRKQFVEIVAAFWDERGKLMRQEYSSADDRRVATDGLAADRDVKLQQIFDAAQFAQVSERLDRMGNRGGRNFPGRSNRGNRGGR